MLVECVKAGVLFLVFQEQEKGENDLCTEKRGIFWGLPETEAVRTLPVVSSVTMKGGEVGSERRKVLFRYHQSGGAWQEGSEGSVLRTIDGGDGAATTSAVPAVPFCDEPGFLFGAMSVGVGRSRKGGGPQRKAPVSDGPVDAFGDEGEGGAEGQGTADWFHLGPARQVAVVCHWSLEGRRAQQHRRSSLYRRVSQARSAGQEELVAAPSLHYRLPCQFGCAGQGTKFASLSRGLLRQARIAAAYQLGLNIKMVLRYTPTGRNWADGPSRKQKLGVAKKPKGQRVRVPGWV